MKRVAPPAALDAQGLASLPLDFQAPYSASIVTGAALYFQLWYRDPGGMSFAFNLSDSIEISFQ